GLDIGSTKVCTLIAAVRPSGLEPIGVGVAESKGIKKGAVVNLEAVVEAIKKSVSEAEAMAGCEVETVYVGLAGPHIKSFNSRGVTSIPTRSREINSDDVRRVIETARAVALAQACCIAPDLCSMKSNLTATRMQSLISNIPVLQKLSGGLTTIKAHFLPPRMLRISSRTRATENFMIRILSPAPALSPLSPSSASGSIRLRFRI